MRCDFALIRDPLQDAGSCCSRLSWLRARKQIKCHPTNRGRGGSFRAMNQSNLFCCKKLVSCCRSGKAPRTLRMATRVPLYQGMVVLGSV